MGDVATMSEESESLTQLKERFGEAILEAAEVGEGVRLTVEAEHLAEVCAYLRDEPSLAFDYPADLTARDTGDRIVLWYRLVSMGHRKTAVLHVLLPREVPAVDSVYRDLPGMNCTSANASIFLASASGAIPRRAIPPGCASCCPRTGSASVPGSDYEPVFADDPLHGPQERN